MKKINNNNYQCVNVPTETYTKKEQSPKGLGYSAIGYDLNHEEKGVDNQIWVVQIKNSKKVWFRKSGMPIVTHEEPLLTDNNIIEDKEIIITNTITTIKEEQLEQQTEIKNEKQEKKITDYNYFYKYYSNKLKTENSSKNKEIKKSNKDIQNEIFEEWNRLKKNKVELDELLKVIKNK